MHNKIMQHVRSLLAGLVLTSFAMAGRAAEKEVTLYDGVAPGSETWERKEQSKTNAQGKLEYVFNVVKPTLTVFQPETAKANGTAAIICPGGGFFLLSMEHEGYQLARFLTSKGVTCFVLKYRTVQCQTDNPFAELSTRRDAMAAGAKVAVEDGRVAFKHIKAHAKEYGVNPDRIGVVGFSAGGILTLTVGSEYTAETRPAFIAPIYGVFDMEKDGKSVPQDAPPLFLMAASDDPIKFGPTSAAVYQAWLKAKRPAELHLYSKGGHGFGMRKQNLPSDSWPDRLSDWLEAQGLLKK
jgi:acetyl esterase/lipase